MHAVKDKYLLLDESQDLSPDQWAWAKANAAAIYAVGDHRQSIYAWRGAERGGLLAQAFETGGQPDLFTDGGSFDLSVNRRSCSAIVELSNRLVPASRPALSERSGGSVTALRVSFASEEIAALIQFAKTSQGTAAILARTNTEVAKIKAELTLANFPHLPVLTIHGAKGLAWDSVAVACGHRKQSDLSDEARETLYVACTRARDSLLLTSVGAFPAELEEALA
jgi:superfamily I DNA/RNA helicase